MNKLTEQIKNKIKDNRDFLEKEYKIKQIGIFGSTGRGDERKDSDVDVVVDFSEPMGFFKFIRLEGYLSSILSKRVDLISKKALKPIIKDDILKEVEYV